MLTGLLRARNDERYVGRAIASFLPVCEQVVVLNDRSTDSTPDICVAMERTTVLDSMFTDLNETRDKTLMLTAALQIFPATTHCLMFDSDEVLVQDDIPLLKALLDSSVEAFSLRILYAWDREDQIRVDGVYQRFVRGSLFRPRVGDCFQSTTHGGNFHCGSVPARLAQKASVSDVRILHLGYMDAADRMRKFEFYNRIDPNSESEDKYQHIIQGDPGGPPAHVKLKHAGPLMLQSINAR